MRQVTKSEFLTKLFETDKQGKEFIMNRKDYEFRDEKSGELFGELKPLINGFEYYLYN
jgi:hypothetical protein